MNNNLALSVIERLRPLIDKCSRRASNAAMDPEDVSSELQLKLLTVFKEQGDAFEQTSLDELVAMASVIVRNYTVDLIRKSVNRPDTSVYCQRVEDAVLDPQNTLRLSIWGNQAKNAIVADVLDKLVAEIRKDRSYVDLYRFVKLCINPDKRVFAAYAEWREGAGAHKNYPGIPPVVVGAALGWNRNKVSRMQDRLAVIFHKLGYSVHEIFGWDHCAKQDDEWFVRCWGVSRQEDLLSCELSSRR